MFRSVCEDLRSAVDDEGARGCYKKSILAFSRITGIPQDGLWAVVDAILQGFEEEKTLKKLMKTYGGTPDLWSEWWEIAKTRPDCKLGDE